MGKSSKIRRLNNLCKSLGLGKFYIGKGRYIKEALSGYDLDYLYQKLAVKVGDIIHDCDGFNHVVIGFFDRERCSIVRYPYYRNTNNKVWTVTQYEFENGYLSCGCPGSDITPRTRDEIEKWYKGYLDYYVPRMNDSFLTKADYKRHEALNSSKHICDERGILLPEFRRDVNE